MDGVFQVREFIALYDEHMSGWGSLGQFFLVSRSAPVVELPAEPTLGWVDGEEGRMLARWVSRDGSVITGPMREGLEATHIAAFTPATAVPTEALDRLRVCISRDETDRAGGWDAAQRLRAIIDAFLAAVDEANS